MASKNAVVIFSKNTCCMCHAIKRLMCGMGVDPIVYECDDHNLTWKHTLFSLLGNSSSSSLLVVFSGGKLVGSMDILVFLATPPPPHGDIKTTLFKAENAKNFLNLSKNPLKLLISLFLGH
ncbi:Glutaredoxin-C8 [Capsicum chinense]|nr:Glutaredoxin-C8 [Capsicum chinense]